MKIWQAILLVTLAGVAGCGQQAPIQSNVIVQRGEVVLRQPSAPDQPFIEVSFLGAINLEYDDNS